MPASEKQSNPLAVMLTVPLVILALVQLYTTVGIYYDNLKDTDGWRLANGRIVGGDFITFYLAGERMRKEPNDLYDFAKHDERLKAIYKEHHLQEEDGALPFIYPPLVAFIFSRLSLHSFLQAYLDWIFLSVSMFLGSLWIVLRTLKVDSNFLLICIVVALAFVPFSIECLGAGQTSCVGLFGFALVFGFLKLKQDFWAGVALGLSYYKPPLFLVFVALLILRGRWRMFGGFMLIAVVLTAATIAMVGFDGFLDYLHKASSYRYGQPIVGGVSLPPDKGVGLFAFFVQILPGSLGTAQLLFGVVGLAIVLGHSLLTRDAYSSSHRESEAFDLAFAVDVALSLLLSVQMVVYDLTILVLPMLIVFSYLWRPLPAWLTAFHILAVYALFLEYTFRSIALGPITIKVTTLVFLAWIISSVLMLLQIRTSKALDLAVGDGSAMESRPTL